MHQIQHKDASLETSLPKYYEVVNIRVAGKVLDFIMEKDRAEDVLTLALDAQSVRRKDDNGFLHVGQSPLIKVQVVHYLGMKIPGWQERGLEPHKKYWGYRPADEPEKAVATFNGLPVMLNHHVVTADAPSKEYQVGHTGTDATFASPYPKNSLVITDRMGIDAVESARYRLLTGMSRISVRKCRWQGVPPCDPQHAGQPRSACTAWSCQS